MDSRNGAPLAGAEVIFGITTTTYPDFCSPKELPPIGRGELHRKFVTDATGGFDFQFPDLRDAPDCPPGAPCLPHPPRPRRHLRMRVTKKGYLPLDSLLMNESKIGLIPADARIRTRAQALTAARKLAPAGRWLSRYSRDYTACAAVHETGAWITEFRAEPSPRDPRAFELPNLYLFVDAATGEARFVSCPDQGIPLEILPAVNGKIRVKDSLSSYVYECERCAREDGQSCEHAPRADEKLTLGHYSGHALGCGQLGAELIELGLVSWDPAQVEKWKKQVPGYANRPPELRSHGTLSGCRRIK